MTEQIIEDFRIYVKKFKGINGIGICNNDFIVYVNRRNYRKLNKKIPKSFNDINVYICVVINSWFL
jgi:hypothetical protein